MTRPRSAIISLEKTPYYHCISRCVRRAFLCLGPDLIRRHHLGEPLLPAEQDKVQEIVHTWRDRLSSISWFMACLNEFIARKAVREQ